jgi:intein/homing endonuclease
MISDLNQCSQSCFKCIRGYKKKHELKKGQKFEIRCSGIPKDHIPASVLESIKPEEQETAKSLFDPVVWAAQNLDWHCLDPDGEIWKRKNPDEYWEWVNANPGEDILGHSRYHRPYQAQMLRCLHGDTKVFMADGTVKSIKDINIGDKVVTYNENRKSIQNSYKVLNKWNNGIQDIYKVELNNGDILKVTSNHPILSWFHSGKLNKLVDKKSFRCTYKSLDDGLSVGDKVYTLNKFGPFGKESNIYAARLMGYIVSDGYVQNSGKVGEKHVVEFRNIRKQYVEEFADLVETVFGVDRPLVKYRPERVDEDGVVHKQHWSVSVFNRDHLLLSTLREIGCTDKTNRELSLLNFAFLYNKEALQNFINRCWSGDGCIYNQDNPNLKFKRTYISLSSGNREFLSLYRILLKKIGVYASHIYTDRKKSSTTINLTISRIEDIENFLEFVGPIFGKEKQSIIAIEQTRLRNHQKRRGRLKTLSRTSIKRIEYIGKEEVWDIEVDKRHNFIADGVVVHNCTSKRKVFRIGRQAGKCLASGTMIQMADGTQKPVEEIQDGDLVVSINDDYKSVINKAYRACNGIKPVYRIELMDGRSIEATDNHPFLSRKRVGRETTGKRRAIFKDEWIETLDLTQDDYLAVPSNVKLTENIYFQDTTHEELLLGCIIADGNITDNNCRFSNTNPKILKAFEEAVEQQGCSLVQYESDQSECDFHVIGSGCGKTHNIKNWLRRLGLQGLDSHKKFIPDQYMTGANYQVAALLNAMYGCDGWASVCADGSIEIGYSTVSIRLAQQIVALLARFGIYATCNNKIVKLNGRKFFSKQIVITRKTSIERFRNQIGILGKEEVVEKVYRVSQDKNPSYKTEAYEDGDITFIRVRSVEYLGEKQTWDLTVPETHNFIANNIVTHNTETLVVSMLFSLFTKPGVPDSEGFTIIVVTPYQSQIDLIFGRMLELIRSSSITQNSLKRNVKAPTYTIELHNNSLIRGFTAGTKSGGNAEAVRGQHAHMLVFDEADYLSSGDMDAALAIITNYPNATVWMSSTPSGKRERFYEACYSKRYQEFHFPSSINPLWNENLEADFREQLTEIGYTQECDAEFGEQEEGVFQNAYVQVAKADYRYGDIEPHHSWTYTFGVDWNDTKNGTTINILGFDPRRIER